MLVRNKTNGTPLPIIREADQILKQSHMALRNRKPNSKAILTQRNSYSTNSDAQLLDLPAEKIIKDSKSNPFLRSKLKILLKGQSPKQEKPHLFSGKATDEDSQMSTFRHESRSASALQANKLKEIQRVLDDHKRA